MAAAVPVAVAAGAVQAKQARDAQHAGPIEPSLLEKLKLRETTACGAVSYGLYCSNDNSRCVYRTQFGFEYACSKPSCVDGPPAALVEWCQN